MTLLAIDPGNKESAYAIIDDQLRPIHFNKLPNEDLLENQHLYTAERIVIEQIGHYGRGMPAGKEVFDTCVWIGRFWQALLPTPIDLIPRVKVKTHLCGSAKAKDGNVVQALVDRFAPGVRNAGKGLKNDPGWFYGFHSDIWQAYALAIYAHDVLIKGET